MNNLLTFIKENGTKTVNVLVSMTGKEYTETTYILAPNFLPVNLVIEAKVLFTPTDGTRTPKLRIWPTNSSTLYCNRIGVGFYGYQYELIEV